MGKFSFIKNKKFKHGSIATLMTVGFIAAVILVNILASMLVERFDLNLDITADKVFSLSEQSIAFTQEINEDVKIYVLSEEAELANAGGYYKQANEIIKKYAQHSPHIKVEYIDLTAQPTFASQYTGAQEYGVVVESAKRYKVLALEDLYEVAYDNYGSRSISSSIAEQAMTGALMYVTNTSTVVATFITGHNEAYENTALESLLTANNYQVETVSLLTDEINQESQFVIICSPETDYTEAEIKKLDAYLDNNGELNRNVIFTATPSAKDFSNLNAFLADWGIEVGSGIIMETDSNKIFYDNATILNTLVDTTYSGGLNESQTAAFIPFTRPLNALFETQDNRTVSPLFQTYDTTVLVPFDADEKNWDAANAVKQSFYTGMVGKKTIEGTGEEEASSRVFAFGSYYIFDSTFTSESSLANGDYFISMVNTISDKQDDLQIVPKSLSGKAVDMSDTARNIWASVFIFVLPLLVLAGGIIIWLMRKNR